MELVRIEIVSEKPTVVEEIRDFIRRNQDPVERRNHLIDSIVENRDPDPIPMRRDLFGVTYQSSWRPVTDLKSVSHQIVGIEISEGNIYGWIKILATPMGKPLLEIKDMVVMILRPVYFDMNKILTFDIDFRKKEAA